LAVAVVAFGAGYHWFGPGLIVTDYPPTPPEAAAQGITLLQRTSFHVAVIPLVILGIMGVLIAITPKQSQSPDRLGEGA
jgi:hypothetical protein